MVAVQRLDPLGEVPGPAAVGAVVLGHVPVRLGGDLLELCLTLGSCILTESGAAANDADAREKLERGIADGSALAKLAELVEAQGGDRRAVYDTSLLPSAPVTLEVPSPAGGYVSGIAAEHSGLVSMHLGGGRATKDSVIDLSVGFVLNKKTGDAVEKGESLATIHAHDEKSAAEAAASLAGCFSFSDTKPETPGIIRTIIR